MINPDLDVCPDYTDIENIHQLLIAIKKKKIYLFNNRKKFVRK